MPKISVITPVYNGEQYLREAIDSILAQTYTDFEFIILDDGSTDSSADIVRSYDDSRIRFVRNERNMGVAATLNRGLDLAVGEYIARMDADDISLPERFEKQVKFLDCHLDVAICGSCIDVFCDGNDGQTYVYSKTDEQIRADMIFNSAFAHPSVMLRRQIFVRYGLKYDCKYEKAEDYELWGRVLRYAKGYNLQEPLLRYRHHAAQVTRTQKTVQTEAVLNIHKEMMNELRVVLSEMEFSVFLKVCSGIRNFNEAEYRAFISGGKKILRAVDPGHRALKRNYANLNIAVRHMSKPDERMYFSWWDFAWEVYHWWKRIFS